MKLARNMPKYL